MFRNFKRLALLVALVLIFTISTQNTLAYVITVTPSILNTFIPQTTLNNDLVISKTVQHPYGTDYTIPENIVFEFRVSLGAYYANAKLDTSAGEILTDETGSFTISLNHGGKLAVRDLEDGTTVTVEELPTSRPGFTVQGSDTQVVTISGDAAATVEFVNVYIPQKADPTNVIITGEKILEGRDWQEGDRFTFRLELQKEDGTWVEIGTKTITYDANNPDFAKFSFTDVVRGLTFDTIGEYQLRMTEVAGELDHMVYDQTKKFINIQVEDRNMDGTLDITGLTASDNVELGKTEAGELTAHAKFNNTYDAPQVPEDIVVSLNVQKTVVNNNESKVIGPENFKIILTDLDANVAIPVMTGSDGTALFELLYSASDIGKTYSYTIHEEEGAVKNITYDKTVYTVQVTVTHDETQNILVPVITVNGETVDSVLCGFRNIHNENITPPTGDMMQLGFWSAVMIASGIGIIVVLFSQPKKKEC